MMDRANLNTSVGRHSIVYATELKEIYTQTIPAASRKFICIECGEYVTYVARTNKHHVPFFRHLDLTQDEIGCSLRDNINSNKTVYESSGLPLYLKKSNINQFELFIGFYSLENMSIDSAEGARARVEISPSLTDASMSVKYAVNTYNFFHSKTTLKKIDFLSKRYYLSYTPSTWEGTLKQRWGGHIEGFIKGGALFDYGPNGGRKIRVNDEITTNTNYYYVCPESVSLSNIMGIKFEKCGIISLKSGSVRSILSIYKIEFSAENDQQFKELNYFCREYLNVSLMYRPLNLIPVWPPSSVIDDEIKYFEKEDEGTFILKTDEETKGVFVHRGNSANLQEGIKIKSNSLMFKSPISDNRTVLTINEKYNPINLLLNRYNEKIPTTNQNIQVMDSSGGEFKIGTHNRLPFKRQITIFSENRCDILQIRNDIIYSYYRVRDNKGVIIQNINFGDEILYVTGIKKKLLLSFAKKVQSEVMSIDNQLVYSKLKKYRGPYMNTPIWVRNVLTSIESQSKLYKLLRSYIFLNVIPMESYYYLKQIYKMEGMEMNNEY